MRYRIFICITLMGVLSCSEKTEEGKTYTENWESLSKVNQTPDWFLDAKFGIYTHWGPIATALEDADPSLRYRGWHGMLMYQDGKKVPTESGKPSNNNIHHNKKYGDPAEYGYKHVIEQFDPSAFDADAWAELFFNSGAKFAGPVAMHHDNFAMWDSKVTRWNSMNYGGVDPSLELKKSIESKGLRFMASFHHAFTWKYFAPAHAYSGIAEENYDLYGNPREIESDTPDDQFYEDWWAKLKEYIDTYEPDLIWFDWWLENFTEESRQKLLAYYYNQGIEWDKEVAVCFKETTFPISTAIRDYERGRPNQIVKPAWLTDTSPGAWFHRSDAQFKSTNEILDILVDIVSKNGLMLLNVPPNPDGSIPKEMQNMLNGIGKWLQVNGEAIYATRPWIVFGEGPTRLPKGGHKVEKHKINYTNEDIRYTTRGDSILYAIVLDKPGARVSLKSLSTDLATITSDIQEVELLGSKEDVVWERNGNGLIIESPKNLPNDYAIAFKITLGSNKETTIDGN